MNYAVDNFQIFKSIIERIMILVMHILGQK